MKVFRVALIAPLCALALALKLSACTSGPSDAQALAALDERAAALNGVAGTELFKIHSVKVLACAEDRYGYACDVEQDCEHALTGRATTVVKRHFMQSQDGAWQIR